MSKIELTLLGQVLSQKNQKSIAYNRSTGKPFIMSNKAVKEWQNHEDVQLLKYRIKGPLSGRQEISIIFYMKDNRRRDLDNLLTSVLDSLVRANILEDDSWQHPIVTGKQIGRAHV